MGYKSPLPYTLQAGITNASFADSSTFYICGYTAVASASGNYFKTYIPRTGSVRRVIIDWVHVTQDCTTENTAISIRKNNTTDYAVYTGSLANAASPQSVSVSVPVTTGDYLYLKLVSPAWVTNPTGTYLQATYLIECE